MTDSLIGRLAVPARFSDVGAEKEFRSAYREAGLAFVRFALILGGVLSFVFFVLVLTIRDDEVPTNPRQLIRLILTVLLMGLAIYISFRPKQAADRYVPLVGGCILFASLAIGAMSLMPTDMEEPRSGRWTVAMCLTCWLAYGFSRLPVAVVAISCLLGSVLILLSAEFYADEYLRALFVYLLMANVIGWVMAVQIERRERALFWSARQLGEATARAEEMARQASESDAAKTRVLAAVSHDLRQPLASLTLYAQLIREQGAESSPARMLHTVDSLEACVGAMSSDLDRLFELGLRERGAALPVETIDLHGILERIERVYSGLAVRAGVRLVVRIPEPGEYSAVSNESRLWDVFANLVGNALKFAAPGRPPWVLVRVRTVPNGLEVVVRDNGIGIEASDQRRVFDEYFQVSNPSRSPKLGHGLGLSIARETISRLPGHSIRLSSSPGKGALFALYLPGSRKVPRAHGSFVARPSSSDFAYPRPAEALAPAHARRASDVAAPRLARYAEDPDTGRSTVAAKLPRGTGDAARVLVIEDDEAMCDALCRTFERWGLLVESAQSGEDAIALALDSQHAFDALVSDFRLPGAWDGLRLIEELRRLEGRRTPALLLSGEFRVETLRCDAPPDVHVMAKPPDVTRLRALLTRFTHARTDVESSLP